MRSALQDGTRDGIGIKTYADGSVYEGFWRAGRKHGIGVFRPAKRPLVLSPSATAAAAAAAGGDYGESFRSEVRRSRIAVHPSRICKMQNA